MKGVEKIDIDRRYCKGCLICKYVCEHDVFELGQERSDLDYRMPQPAKLENCKVCRLCELNCPDMAITVVAKEKGKEKT